MVKLDETTVLKLPEPGCVDLWLLEEQAELPEATYLRMQLWLSAEELIRWQRFHYPQDRLRFLQARALVRCLLARYVEGSPASLQFVRNGYGKPYLQQVNTATTSLKFNLSHTKGLLALAVTVENEVGVDVESMQRELPMLELAQRFFAPSEVEELQQVAPSLLRERFFSLWTLKEAYVKARGLGLQMGLNRFAITLLEEEQPQLLYSEESSNTTDKPCSAAWSFAALKHAEQFCVAVALNVPGVSRDRVSVKTVEV